MSVLIAAPESFGRPLTYEEERGKPMPSKNHSIVQSNLIGEFLKQSEFRVMSELFLRLDGKDYTPDLSIYRREKFDRLRDVIRLQQPPLVIVEIFSPTQGYQEIMNKVEAYLAAGVKSVWVVSPPIGNVTIFTPDGQQHPFTAGTVTDPAIGVTADLDAIFS